MMRALGFVVLIATTAFPQKKNPVVLSVNGKDVRADELAYLFRKNYIDQKDHTAEKVNEYLRLYIRFKLKVEEAINRGLDTTRQFVREFNTYRSELRKTYLHEEKLTDSLVRLTYERLKEEIKASHILAALPADATPPDTLQAWRRLTDILERIKRNESFSELAEKFSDDPSARNNRGNLGYFTALQMVYPFETAAYAARTGDVAGPVRTRFGYHLIKIEDRKPSRGEVEVSHIMLRHIPGRDENQTRNLIFDIHQQLKNGMPWEDLCSRYSEDLNSKNNNCRLRPFGVGAFNQVPEFDAVAFSLQNPGDISDPFRTDYGWHIVRLERKIPLPPLDELKTSLRNRVMRDERMQVARERYYQKLKNRFSYKENTTIKNIIFSAADTSLTRGRWNVPDIATHEMLLEVNGKKISADRFIQFVKTNQQLTSLKPSDYMLELYRKFTESVLDEQMENEIMQVKPEYRYLLNEYYEGILLFDIMEKEIWNKAAEDTLQLREFFNTHRNRYKAGERVRAVIYSAPSPEILRPLKSYLEQQDSAAAKKWVRDRQIRNETGRFQRSERLVLQLAPWQEGLYEVENQGMYYLVHILEILQPGLLTFEEALINVVSDYQQALEEQWLKDLQKKYPVVLHEKGRKQLIRMVRK